MESQKDEIPVVRLGGGDFLCLYFIRKESVLLFQVKNVSLSIPLLGQNTLKRPFLWKEKAYLSIRLWIVGLRSCLKIIVEA